jgi:prophage tail gpP-like protein
MSDDLTLTVNGQSISGWETVRVTRGIERCPSDWDIEMTERYPDETDEITVAPFDPCSIKIGNDLVVTGYVDRYIPSITATTHTVRITGRGKCQDLVDCSAEWPNGQITGSSALEIAKKLAAPYGIQVNATQVDVGPPIPQTNLIRGETGWEIIERICRFRGLLAYEMPDGSLFLTQTGTVSAASGFIQGQNVQQANIAYSGDQRFSIYKAFLQSMQLLSDAAPPGVIEGGDLLGIATDPGVPRHRQMDIIAQGGGLEGLDVCVRTATWEMNRRVGRGNALSLTTDSWRDSAGTLWTPNTLVPLSLPSLKLPQATWLIGSVTYKLDENGTTADLVIMPPGAFLPQPIVYLPEPIAEAHR